MTETTETDLATMNSIIADYMGLCTHPELEPRVFCWRCVDCKEPNPEIPQYTSEDSPRRLLNNVEAEVVAEFGARTFFLTLVSVTASSEETNGIENYRFTTAREFCEAIIRTIGRWSEVDPLAREFEPFKQGTLIVKSEENV